jgi:hypothetical protein
LKKAPSNNGKWWDNTKLKKDWESGQTWPKSGIINYTLNIWDLIWKWLVDQKLTLCCWEEFYFIIECGKERTVVCGFL